MKLELLIQQTENTYAWLKCVLKDIPKDKWDEIPENIETNITWQIGHLIMSFNYHTVIVLKGSSQELNEQFPIKKYSKLFTQAPAFACVGKINSEELISNLELVLNYSLKLLKV
tara:strand:- start:287 stop:628 length:342 start_codon:yes stop_codon:yes gene_type:complete